MTKKIKVLAIPTLLLVAGLASCNTLNKSVDTKTVSYEEAYRHVVKNHDPHLNDGLFANYTVTINDLGVTNLSTYEKNATTGDLDVINDISVSLHDVSESIDLPYTIGVGSKLFAKYGGYLNAPAAFSYLGLGAEVDYGYTIDNGCLGYFLETNMLTPAINVAGGILQLLLGEESQSSFTVDFDGNGGYYYDESGAMCKYYSQTVEEAYELDVPTFYKDDGKGGEVANNGWSYEPGGDPINIYFLTEPTTLYAVWPEEPATEFTVTFMVNDETEFLVEPSPSLEKTFYEIPGYFAQEEVPTYVSKDKLEQKGWTIYTDFGVVDEISLEGITDYPFSTNSRIHALWGSSTSKTAEAVKAKGKSQSISTYLKMIQNVSVGDTTVGLYLKFTDFGFIDSIRVKLNISDLFAPLDVSVLDDPDLIAIFGPLVGDAFKIGDLTLDVTLSAQYK